MPACACLPASPARATPKASTRPELQPASRQGGRGEPQAGYESFPDLSEIRPAMRDGNWLQIAIPRSGTILPLGTSKEQGWEIVYLTSIFES